MFKWWSRTRKMEIASPYSWWWDHWLQIPLQSSNPFYNFLKKLSIPIELANIPKHLFTLSQIELVKIATVKELNNSHSALTNKLIQNSKFHPYYKLLNNVQVMTPQSHMMDPTPYMYKSFLCQLRIHPYCIKTKLGTLIIDRTSQCHLCEGNILTGITWLTNAPKLKC